MNRKIIFGIIGGAILAVIGLFIGMNIGGNYFPDFRFLTGRGYEATGYLGALIGALIGIILGVLFETKFSKNQNL